MGKRTRVGKEEKYSIFLQITFIPSHRIHFTQETVSTEGPEQSFNWSIHTLVRFFTPGNPPQLIEHFVKSDHSL